MLKFNENGKFTVMAFGDTHMDDIFSKEGQKKYNDMLALHYAALDEFSPDLCVYMGDNCRIYNLDTPAAVADFKTRIELVTNPVRERNIPFASVFGNHCHDYGYEKEQLGVYMSLPGCIMRNDSPEDVTGFANYNEFIYSHDGKTPLFNLWFIDSNNLGEDGVSKYDFVHKDQIEWYEKRAAEIAAANGGEVMPAFLFQHIPVPEEYELLRPAKLYELPLATRGHSSYMDEYYMLKDGVTGYLGEGPACPDVNSGQFESWKKTGDIIGACFGHDHLNDFCGFVDGIALMQTKTAGFGCYTDGCRSGVRVITFYENDLRHFDTQMKHFKEFGLKAKSLGPFMRTLTDRQSINLHYAAYSAGAVAGVAAAVAGIKNLRRK